MPEAMSFDPTWIFASFVAGSVGFVLFYYGKKQARWPQLVAGLLLMVYPYFVTSLGGLLAVGIALVAGLWFAIRLGW